MTAFRPNPACLHWKGLCREKKQSYAIITYRRLCCQQRQATILRPHGLRSRRFAIHVFTEILALLLKKWKTFKKKDWFYLNYKKIHIFYSSQRYPFWPTHKTVNTYSMKSWPAPLLPWIPSDNFMEGAQWNEWMERHSRALPWTEVNTHTEQNSFNGRYSPCFFFKI